MRRNCNHATVVLVLALLLSGDHWLLAQDPLVVSTTVTGIYGSNLFFDKGTAEGIQPGTRVRIVLKPGETVEAVIGSVSGDGARGLVAEGAERVRVGMLGYAAISPLKQLGATTALDNSHSASMQSEGVVQVAALPPPRQPGAVQRLQARVTATSGGSVYLNIGREAGLQPGDEVTFFPPNDGIVNGTVQSVSSSSSRCAVLSTSRAIDIGTRAEVLIPAERLVVEPPQPAGRSGVPEHPPWTAMPEDWDETQPLLAPAYSRTASEREFDLHGRLFASYMHTLNQFDTRNQYSLGRAGASLWMENPFRRGGGLHVDGEFNRRGVFLQEDGDAISGPGWINRLSYYWGGTETEPLRWEAGRFLSSEFPEFGVLDGTEVVYRTEVGHRLGASVGLLPEPFPNLAFRDDLYVIVFYRWIYDPEETLTSGVGFQKTWQEGSPDRDLLIWTTDYDPNDYLSVHSTVWIDFYNHADRLKSTSAEVTQAILQPIFRINPRHGFGGHLSSVRWPQLLRRDYSPFVEQQIVGDHVFRWGLFTWHDLGERTRLDGRVDQWRDESHETGTSWEGRVAFRDWLYDHGEVAFSLYTTQGLYSDGPGARVALNRRLPWCFASLWYDFARNRLKQQDDGLSLNNQTGVLFQHSIRANLDFSLSSDRSVSIYSDYRFGPSQEAISAGIFLQKRL